MKNVFHLSAITFSLFILTAAQCNKSTPLPEFYFQCKVDGQEYRPNGCTNCNIVRLLGDTAFIFGANRGFESIGAGVYDYPVNVKTYTLNNSRNNADYDNSPLVNDIYKTDSAHTGELKIISIDRSSKIIEGTFFFKAYNTVQNKTINITEGKFRRKYTTD